MYWTPHLSKKRSAYDVYAPLPEIWRSPIGRSSERALTSALCMHCESRAKSCASTCESPRMPGGNGEGGGGWTWPMDAWTAACDCDADGTRDVGMVVVV